MKQGLIGAATALAAVITYGAVTGAQAPAQRRTGGLSAARGQDPVGRCARLRVRHHQGRNRLRAEERSRQPA